MTTMVLKIKGTGLSSERSQLCAFHSISTEMRGNMSDQASTLSSELGEVSRSSDGTRIGLRKRGLEKRSASVSDLSISLRSRNSIEMDVCKKDLVTTTDRSTSNAKKSTASNHNMEERKISRTDLKSSGGSQAGIDARRRGLVKRSASISNRKRLFGTSNGSETDERKRGLKKRSASFSDATKSSSIGNIFDLDESKSIETAIASSSNVKTGPGSNNSTLDRTRRRLVKRSASFSNLNKDYGTSNGGNEMDRRNIGLAKRSASLRDLTRKPCRADNDDAVPGEKITSTSDLKKVSESSNGKNMDVRRKGLEKMSLSFANAGEDSEISNKMDKRRKGPKRSASFSNFSRDCHVTGDDTKMSPGKRGQDISFLNINEDCSTSNTIEMEESKVTGTTPAVTSTVKKGSGNNNVSKIYKSKRNLYKRSASFSDLNTDGGSHKSSEIDRRKGGLVKRSASFSNFSKEGDSEDADVGKQDARKRRQEKKPTSSTSDLKKVSGNSNGKKIDARERGLEKKSVTFSDLEDCGTSNKMVKNKKGLLRSASFCKRRKAHGTSALKRSASYSDISRDSRNKNHGSEMDAEKRRSAKKNSASTSDLSEVGIANRDARKKSQKGCKLKEESVNQKRNSCTLNASTAKDEEKAVIDCENKTDEKVARDLTNFTKEEDGETIEDVKEDAGKIRQEKKSSSSTSDLKEVSGKSNGNKIDGRKGGPEKKSVTFSDLKEFGTSNKMDKKRRGLLRSESFSNRSRDHGTSDDTKTGIVKRRLLKRSASCSDISRDSGTSNHGSKMDARTRRSEEKNSASASDLSEVGLAKNDRRKKCQKECERKLKGKRVMQKLKSATSNSSTVKDEEKAVIECEEKSDEKLVGDLTADDMAIVAEARAAEEEKKMILILETRLKVIEAMKKLDMENIEAWKIEKKRKLQQKRFRKLKDDIEMKQIAIEANATSSEQCSLIEDEKQNNILLQGYVEILQRERERCMVLNTQHRNQYRHYVALWEQVKGKSKAEEIQNDNLNALKSAVEMLQAAIKSRQKNYESDVRMKMRIRKAIQDIVQLLSRQCNDIFLFLDVKNLAAAVEPEYDLFLANDSYTEDMTVMTDSSDISYFIASENPIVFFDPLQRVKPASKIALKETARIPYANALYTRK